MQLCVSSRHHSSSGGLEEHFSQHLSHPLVVPGKARGCMFRLKNTKSFSLGREFLPSALQEGQFGAVTFPRQLHAVIFTTFGIF